LELPEKGFSVINKYEEDFYLSTVFHRTYSFCPIKEMFTVIAADSNVYFCHDKAYVKSGEVGSLKNRSFKELWYSKEVIERYNNFNAECECNHHCVYDERNILLNSFLELNDNHINFI
jgi:sulfatase maturation enzyme AslB (radical SAM superfamily)